jgi:predicted transcriptional regulator
LCKVKIPVELMKINSDRTIKISFEVDESFPGGLAIYGKRFGRYPVDPVLLFE